MPGGIHLMLNGFAEAQNAAVGPAGIPEIGQSGEGLWDAQHAHQLIHQAMIALQPLAGIEGWHPEGVMKEGRYDLTVFGGQGSATIGPPIFMHRAPDGAPQAPQGREPPRDVPGPRYVAAHRGYLVRDVGVQRPRTDTAGQPPVPARGGSRVHRFARPERVRRASRGPGVRGAAPRTPDRRQTGLFAEATFISIPPSLRAIYGTESAVTLDVGVHVFGMWMLDGRLHPMQHGGS